jgi:hypothetical protein
VKRLANFGLALAFVAASGLAGAAIAANGGEQSVTGNLEDAYCYGTMGAKGAGHKACAIKCAPREFP